MAMTCARAIICGRATRDSEIRTVNGKNGEFQAATLNLAVDRAWNLPKGPTGEDTTDFFRVELTGPQANYSQYAHKGDLVLVFASMYLGKPYNDKDNVVHRDWVFKAEDIYVFGKPVTANGQNPADAMAGNMAGGYQNQGYQNNGNGGYQNQPRPQNNGYQQNPPQNGGYQQGYQNGGYPQNQPPQNNGYQQNPPQNGGYQQNPPQNGGYQQNPPQNGGYPQNQPPQNGGFNGMNPPDGFGPMGADVNDPFGLGQ